MSTWSGLGMFFGQPNGSWPNFVANYQVQSAEFAPKLKDVPRLRMISDAFYFSNSTQAYQLWAKEIKNRYPDKYILYGIARSSGAYWPTYYTSYLPLMLSEAQWAQYNLMDSFCIANEVEYGSRNGTLALTSLTRTSNVTVAVCTAPHNLLAGDTITIPTATPTSFRVNQSAMTIINSTTFSYPNPGLDDVASGGLAMQPGIATIVRLMKLLGTQARTVFTRGPILYSFAQGFESYWSTITPGVDIDLIGLNAYPATDWPGFKNRINTMLGWHGDNFVITEFNIHYDWSQAFVRSLTPSRKDFDILFGDEITKIAKYLENLGVSQAYFYTGWNGSAGDNNNFTIYYNTEQNTGSAKLSGGFKAGFNQILGKRIGHVMIGTQQHT